MDASSFVNVTAPRATDGAVGKSVWYNLSVAALSVLGSVGNGLCCYALLRYKFLRSVPNFLVTSLAASDLVLCLLVMPLTVYDGLRQGGWTLGSVLCRLWPFFISIGAVSCRLSLCLISLDRCLSVAAPVRYLRYRKPRVVVAGILCMWLAVVGVSLPLLVSDLAYRGDRCSPSGAIFARNGVLNGCLFVGPTFILLVVNVCTARITWKLNRPRRIGPAPGQARTPSRREARADNLESNQFHPDQRGCSIRGSTARGPAGVATDAALANIPGPSLSQEHRRNPTGVGAASAMAYAGREQSSSVQRGNWQQIVNVMAMRRRKSFAVIGVVVGSYIVCWTPSFCVALYYAMHPEIRQALVNPWPLVACRWLGFFNSTINPIIYASMKKDYKRAIKMLLRCRRA
ncbi:D(4) dopamine receptor-like [Acanthaster planci]|uniref:D(4) dopamine receptor-like n=1 Tax=Acanthaster planci TaxID=133434 RepID=A0A8B7Y082_ACAPL|nr:D(4) dopamine receptor-like [Acanthaster planci]